MEAAKDNDLTVEDLESGDDLVEEQDDEIRVHFNQEGCDSDCPEPQHLHPRANSVNHPRLLQFIRGNSFCK